MTSLERLPSVRSRLGKGRSSIYSDINLGLFPPPVKVGLRASAWPTNEVDEVIAARIAGVSTKELRTLVRELVKRRNGER
jgi:prophage regulatory protein